jgi:twitching motility protein PilT
MGAALFEHILKSAVEVGASDIHLKVGLPSLVRYKEEIRVLSKGKEILQRQDLDSMIQAIIPERLKNDFEKNLEIDFAYSFSGVGRFRLNIYSHRGQPAMAIRYIPFHVRSVDDLGLPQILKKLILKKRGLILITGPAGSGKSSTLAALIEEANKTQSGHIITIEDPIEYLIRDRKAIITQRELGLDTESFRSGIKNALRQDPDIIMIGELRDKESVEEALAAAETGHLVLATLHTGSAVSAVDRLLDSFPAAERDMAAAIAQATGERFVDTLAIIARFLDEVLRTLAAGNDVELRGFGKFAVRTRKGRTCATGLTGGRPVTIPTKRFVGFQMGSLLKAGVTDGKKVTLLGVKRCRKSKKQPS